MRMTLCAEVRWLLACKLAGWSMALVAPEATPPLLLAYRAVFTWFEPDPKSVVGRRRRKRCS